MKAETLKIKCDPVHYLTTLAPALGSISEDFKYHLDSGELEISREDALKIWDGTIDLFDFLINLHEALFK